MMRTEQTVLVVGGGPAGGVAARALAQAGLRVTLAHAGEPEFRVGESMLPTGRTALREIGLWERFLADGHARCPGNLSAWGSEDLLETDFIRSPYGPGWHLDRSRFDAMLREGAREAGADVLASRVLKVTREEGRWRADLRPAPHDRPGAERGGTARGGDNHPASVWCDWLVDCTGRGGRIAAACGAERAYEDRQVAFYLRFHAGTDSDQDGRTLVESAREGWFHTALLPTGERIVTLFTDAAGGWARTAGRTEGFVELMSTETIHLARLIAAHAYLPLDGPTSTDARSSRLDRMFGDGWLAAGDAATAFDPLASQGILSALYSGIKAARAVACAIAGELDALPAYQRALESVYDHFVQARRGYHAQETRWPEAVYWKARNGARIGGTASD